MKNIVLLGHLIALFSFTQCARETQLVTLQGSNLQSQPKGLTYENDTLRLTYQFDSERGEMRFTIFNKLRLPLYVDWKKSAYIVGKDKFDYWIDEATLNAYADSYNVRYNRWLSASSTDISGTIRKDERIAFIPPRTEIVKNRFVVKPDGKILQRTQPQIKKVPKTWISARKPAVVKEYFYEADNSPVQFRNFLTFSTQEDFQSEFHVETEFWSPEIREMKKKQFVGMATGTDANGNALRSYPYRTADRFYLFYHSEEVVQR